MMVIFGAKRPPHYRRNIALKKDKRYCELYHRKDWDGVENRIRELGWELDDEPDRKEPVLPDSLPLSRSRSVFPMAADSSCIHMYRPCASPGTAISSIVLVTEIIFFSLGNKLFHSAAKRL